jgi:hypothetical protein
MRYLVQVGISVLELEVKHTYVHTNNFNFMYEMCTCIFLCRLYLICNNAVDYIGLSYVGILPIFCYVNRCVVTELHIICWKNLTELRVFIKDYISFFFVLSPLC